MPTTPLALGFIKDAGRIFAAQAIGSSYMRVLDFIVAFGFGAAAVGFMRIASRFVDIVYGTFVSQISSLWVVLLSEGTQTKGDRDLLYRRLSQMSALIILPIFSGLALTSKDVVAVPLSADHALSANMLMILCLVGLFAPFTYFRNAAFVAVKRLNLLISFSILDLVLVISAGIALSRYSVRGRDDIIAYCRGRSYGTHRTSTHKGHAHQAAKPTVRRDASLSRLRSDGGAAAYVSYLLIFHRNWSMVAIKMLRTAGQAAITDSPVSIPVIS